jgi:hypothetical protein
MFRKMTTPIIIMIRKQVIYWGIVVKNSGNLNHQQGL